MSYVSPENSKLLYGTRAQVLADGTTAGVVKVRLRDHKNRPVPNRQVELFANREDVTIVQPPVTNADGLALGYVTSAVAGPVTISGRVIPTT
jgi:ribosomal protein S12 methylthiotransferase accessory factor YcaO